MQFPIKAHYAAVAMTSLAAVHHSGQPLAAREIARQRQIPSQFLGQILQQLRTAGLISSLRGANGGFRLARPPQEITLGEVVEAVCYHGGGEDSHASHDPVTHVVSKVWRDLGEQQSESLSRITLADLVYQLAPEPAGMFYI